MKRVKRGGGGGGMLYPWVNEDWLDMSWLKLKILMMNFSYPFGMFQVITSNGRFFPVVVVSRLVFCV